MRIVIDARLWSESGLGRYIRNLINELQEIDKLNEYYVLLLKKDFDQINFKSNNFHKVLADFKWYGFSEQIKLPKLLKELKPDLVHFPHFNVPVFYKGKFVVTIHDLIHQHFQTRNTSTLNPLLHAIKKIGYKKAFSSAIKNSSKIITPSEFVKGQLMKEWGIKGDKVMVTYEGVDDKIIQLAKEKSVGSFQKPYLFYIGNAQPHKNLSRLISVFSKLKEKYPDLSLVLSGPDHYFWEKIKKESHPRGGILFTGFVSEEEMVVLYKNAEAFVMPSLEEGFGIPILEAMACSCPVVSSNTASLPEVGGDAVLYFNPEDEEDMIRVIGDILGDRGLRNDLIKKGE
ncbi:MAG: glycosyltransferase family 1 protein, partial [Candidatus Daviesbacteria bacterium]|nr:glycosyltransferase family 1 protein [Candidatus Daviesbacteria bacterium]